MEKNSILQQRKRDAEAAEKVVQLHQPDLLSDSKATIRLGWLVLVLGFGSFLAWAAWAPLDEGVPVPATVTFDTKRKTIQHINGGKVERVLVREGQRVKRGDVLVELNEAVNQANFESVRQTYMAQRAAESRLLAEMEERPVIHFHADLMAASADPYVKQHITTQTMLFESRRNALRSELNSLQETVEGQESLLTGITQQLDSRRRQADKQSEQLKNMTELAADGYVPRNQVLTLEQNQAELRAVLADLQANKLRIEHAISELKMRKTLRKQEILKEASAMLAEVRRQVYADSQKLAAAGGELSGSKIKSPVDGQVVGIALGSVGGIVSPGQKLMDIVPDDEGTVLEAKIPAHVIDRINVGDAVDMRFTSFAHSPLLVAEAIVNSISGDVINEATPSGTLSYYLARVSVTPTGKKQLGNRVLQPGMQAELLIKTGERSLLAYVLHPLTKRIAASLKEE
jgi:protease secretion system membrane fusion protein